MKDTQIMLDVYQALMDVLLADVNGFLNLPEESPDLKNLAQRVASIRPIPLEEKLSNVEVQIRQKLLKKPGNSPFDSAKYTEDDIQDIDTAIGKTLKGPCMDVFESGRTILPVLVEYSQEISRFLHLREAFSEWTVEFRVSRD